MTEFIWKTKDGRKLKLDDIDTYHLKNILKFMKKRNGKVVFVENNSYDQLWGYECFKHEINIDKEIEIVEKELERRGRHDKLGVDKL